MRHRAQAYVGAFLRRTPEPAAESESDTVLGPLSTVVKPPKEAATELEDSSGDAAAHLHNIGTFAQVRLTPSRSCNQELSVQRLCSWLHSRACFSLIKMLHILMCRCTPSHQQRAGHSCCCWGTGGCCGQRRSACLSTCALHHVPLRTCCVSGFEQQTC